MLDFSPAPVPALRDWDRGVAKLGFVPSPSPQPLTMGQAMPGPPSEAPRCHGEGGRAGSPPCLTALQKLCSTSSPCSSTAAWAAVPGMGLAASLSWSCQSLEPSGSFPGAQGALASAGITWHCWSLCPNKGKKQSTQIKNNNLEEARSCLGLSCVGTGRGAGCSCTSGSHHSRTRHSSSGKALECSHTDLTFGSKQTRAEHLQISY